MNTLQPGNAGLFADEKSGKIGDGPRFVLDRPLAECSLLATFTT